MLEFGQDNLDIINQQQHHNPQRHHSQSQSMLAHKILHRCIEKVDSENVLSKYGRSSTSLKPQANLVQQTESFFEYIDDGFLVYNSKTLIHRKWQTSGQLKKYCKDSLTIWQDRHITVDFIGLSIVISKTKSKRGKEMLFSDLISVAETSQE